MLLWTEGKASRVWQEDPALHHCAECQALKVRFLLSTTSPGTKWDQAHSVSRGKAGGAAKAVVLDMPSWDTSTQGTCVNYFNPLHHTRLDLLYSVKVCLQLEHESMLTGDITPGNVPSKSRIQNAWSVTISV